MPVLSFNYKQRLDRVINGFTATVIKKMSPEDRKILESARTVSASLAKKMSIELPTNTQITLNNQMNKLSDTLSAVKEKYAM